MPSQSFHQTVVVTECQQIHQQKSTKSKRKKKKASKATMDIIDTVSAMFSASDVNDAVDYLKANEMIITTDNLIEAVYEIQNRQRLGQNTSQGESSKSKANPRHTDCSNLEDSSSSAESESDDDSLPDLKKYTKQWYEKQLQSMRTICHYCHQAKATILLLPCAHLACCTGCLQEVRRCPVSTCKKIVRGTKEVFFV